MGVEIERKYLVRRERWPGASAIQSRTRYQQGYLSRDRGRTVRVRRAGDHAFLTIKGEIVGIARPEFEYEIPLADVEPLLALCAGPLIDKHRHLVPHEGHVWEVDDFLGANAGLLIAEIELVTPDEPFALPDWLGREVTEDRRYLNANLVDHPFSEWGRGP